MCPKDNRDTNADGAALMPRAAEWARVWRDPRITGLELLRATYVTHAFARHAHDTFALGVVEEGAQSFMYRGARQTTPPGGIILVNPDEPTTGEAASASGYTYRMLYPDVALLRHAADEVAGRPQGLPFFRVPVVQDDDMARLLCGLHRTMEGPAPMLERESRLLGTLARLIARHATPRRSW